MYLASEDENLISGGSDRLQLYDFPEERPIRGKRFNCRELCNSKRVKISNENPSRANIRRKVNRADSKALPNATVKMRPCTKKKFGKDVTNVAATKSNHKANKHKDDSIDFSVSNFSKADKLAFTTSTPLVFKRIEAKRSACMDRAGNNEECSHVDMFTMEVNPAGVKALPYATVKRSPHNTEKKFGKDVTNVAATNSHNKANKHMDDSIDFSISNFSKADKLALAGKYQDFCFTKLSKFVSPVHKDQQKPSKEDIFEDGQTKEHFFTKSRMACGLKEVELRRTKPEEEVELSNYRMEKVDVKAKKTCSRADIATKQIASFSIEEFNIDSNAKDVRMFESLSETEECSSNSEMESVRLFDLDSTKTTDTKADKVTVPARSLRQRGSTKNTFKTEESDDSLSPQQLEGVLSCKRYTCWSEFHDEFTVTLNSSIALNFYFKYYECHS